MRQTSSQIWEKRMIGPLINQLAASTLSQNLDQQTKQNDEEWINQFLFDVWLINPKNVFAKKARKSAAPALCYFLLLLTAFFPLGIWNLLPLPLLSTTHPCFAKMFTLSRPKVCSDMYLYISLRKIVFDGSQKFLATFSYFYNFLLLSLLC